MWKLQMSAYLKVQVLMSVVDRTECKPKDSTEAAAWTTKDATATSAILPAIDNS